MTDMPIKLPACTLIILNEDANIMLLQQADGLWTLPFTELPNNETRFRVGVWIVQCVLKWVSVQRCCFAKPKHSITSRSFTLPGTIPNFLPLH
jgi:hypothetical protein